MKKILYILFFISIISLCGCEKYGDSTLNGMTFEYDNGYTGKDRILERYEFQNSGNVYYSSKVGYSSGFNTEGCNLYYTLIGDKITIYYGIKGWKEEMRDKVFATGAYLNNQIIIEDKVFKRK